MAQDPTFTCTACNASTTKWSGKCDTCNAWNTIEEVKPLSAGPKSKKSMGGGRGKQISLTDLATEEAEPPRTLSGVGELDRTLGGGLVKASAILVGGDPGIGKSTLLLQAAARFARNGLKVMYISGEESTSQVQMRARRLGLTESPVQLASETNLRDILTTLSPSSWSATSPKKAQSQGRVWSNTWSTPCFISKASVAINSASCARSKTVSAPQTRSVCLK